MNNTINITISQETCNKIAGVMKMSRSPKAVIYSHMYKNTEEYTINDVCDAIGTTGMYKKGEGLKLTIGISDDLIDAAIDAMITFVPAMTGAIASLAGHMNRFKKLLKIGDDHKKTRVTIDKGDKVRLVYTIGRNKNAVVKTITIGSSEMGEKIDHLLVGLPAGAMIRTDIDVLGVKTRMDILVREIVKADPIDTEKLTEDDAAPNGGIDQETTCDAKKLTGIAGHEHGGNPAVRFSCYENGDKFDDDNDPYADDNDDNDPYADDDSTGDDNHIVNAVRSLRDDARASGMSAEEFFGDTAHLEDLDVKSWEEV